RAERRDPPEEEVVGIAQHAAPPHLVAAPLRGAAPAFGLGHELVVEIQPGRPAGEDLFASGMDGSCDHGLHLALLALCQPLVGFATISATRASSCFFSSGR